MFRSNLSRVGVDSTGASIPASTACSKAALNSSEYRSFIVPKISSPPSVTFADSNEQLLDEFMPNPPLNERVNRRVRQFSASDLFHHFSG